MKVRSLSLIQQLKYPVQLAEISCGMETITENVFKLSACTNALRIDEYERGCRVLKYLMEEESAKVLILMDYVRLPLAEPEKSSRQLKYFYDHFVRCLYVETYNTLKPANWAEVCTWVRQETPSLYLDGPNDVDWIFRNDLIQQRETALYVDYVALDDDRRWYGP
jgi:AbiV family abortive infection protein